MKQKRTKLQTVQKPLTDEPMNRSNFFDQAMNSSKPFSQICTIHSYALLSSHEWFKYIQASCEQFKLHQVKDISDTVPSSHERFKPIQ